MSHPAKSLTIGAAMLTVLRFALESLEIAAWVLAGNALAHQSSGVLPAFLVGVLLRFIIWATRS